jgi:pyruvate dehydrogenase E2 component (dihydrolipoamide acetyltransferase)
MIEDVRIPEISENVKSGKIVNVLVQVGDMIEVDDVLVEFETEKALVEIPSTVKGKIAEILAEVGLEMQVGDVIARVNTEAGASVEGQQEAGDDKQTAEPAQAAAKETTAEAPETEKPDQEEGARPQKEKAAAPQEEKPQVTPEPSKPEAKMRDRPADRGPAPASPSVRRFARELGVDIYEVKAGGPGGRITEADVKAHVKRGERPAGKAPVKEAAAAEGLQEPPLPDFSRWGDIETVELEAVRRITAANMSTAWRTVPHVTQFDQADITGLQEFIKMNVEKVARKGGKLTVTAVLAKVCAAALKKFARFNASIDTANEQLIFKNYIHIGIAADTPRGLLVPVVRNADQKSISTLAAEISDLAERARNKKLKPDEMEGGTFTISNQGGIGGGGFTPIVFWPQAAILGVSRASVVPRYIDGEFKPRSMLPLALSFDHRIIDGADAARFLRWVCESLEQPFTMILE